MTGTPPLICNICAAGQHELSHAPLLGQICIGCACEWRPTR